MTIVFVVYYYSFYRMGFCVLGIVIVLKVERSNDNRSCKSSLVKSV